MSHTVFASAPTRIDFAGGTLDIYPLFLFVGNAITTNAAINLDAQVTLKERSDNRITIHSRDTKKRLDASSLDELPMDGPLALITRTLKYFKPRGGLDIETHLQPPHGSGLGSSSSLFIALTHAISEYMGKPRDPEKLLRLSNHLEAQLMGMPAGTQDYYPATYGGIKAIHFELEEIRCENLEVDGRFWDELQRHLVISYTNMTHHSGSTNWQNMRNFFDEVPQTVLGFHQLKITADRMYAAFQAYNIVEIARALEEEWANRKQLSDRVTTPEIDLMMANAVKAGAWSSKLCGAGGGGCMLTLAPPETHEGVIAALRDSGASYMNVNLVKKGVEVKVN